MGVFVVQIFVVMNIIRSTIGNFNQASQVISLE